MTLRIVVGNKNYSSWSLRPWLALRQTGEAFEEQVISLYDPSSRAELARLSPSGRVPVLYDGSLCVWESLAICEYLAERFPSSRLWPDDQKARAMARSVSHEMHAGFTALRTHLPMGVRRRLPCHDDSPALAAEIARVQSLWQTCRVQYGAGGEFLFGRFSIADAMYAPVAFRFQTYNVSLDAGARRYCDTLLSMPAMQEWAQAAAAEPWSLPQFEK
ncbi:MAG TPA: glutathione S-transferase family protein [Polyangiales bacterium]